MYADGTELANAVFEKNYVVVSLVAQENPIFLTAKRKSECEQYELDWRGTDGMRLLLANHIRSV